MKILQVCVLFSIFLVFEIRACMQTPLVSETPDIPIGAPGSNQPCATCPFFPNKSPMPETLTQVFGVNANGCRTINLTCTNPPGNHLTIYEGTEQRFTVQSRFPGEEMVECNAQGQYFLRIQPVTHAVCDNGQF